MKAKNKLGQFKIQQMIFMLLGITLFFILVGLLFIGFKYKDIGKKAQQLEQEKAIALALSLAESPEFSCGSKCVNSDKLLILKDSQDLGEIVGFLSKIEIRKVYPAVSEKDIIECTKTNYPECNFFTVYDSGKTSEKASASSYIQLCRKELLNNYVYDKCELGEITVKI